MNLNSLGVITILIVASLAVTGCRIAPVYNVHNAPVTVPNETPTMDDVATAIKRAGNTLGWQIKEDSPGQITGTLNLRRHTAVVDIVFNTEEYSILYKDSTALNYDGKQIHRNYNGWIQNLDNAIKVQLNTL